jgi:hypothetical protein
MPKILWSIGLFLLCLLWSYPADASPLAERIASFPDWQSKPVVQVVEGDLTYPQWLAGTWEVTSTLVDLAAPLAPDVVTPGFESNRQYLHQPFQFQVRFVEASLPQARLPFGKFVDRLTLKNQPPEIIADRAFNGFNIARAYLANGDDNPVLSVKLDPNDPNRQITLLRGNRQLVSTITGRATEAPTADRFITTEVFQQLFRGGTQPYLNQVETTTDYHCHTTEVPTIVADQITAVYLSPQDPNYFKASRSSRGLTSDFPLEALQERPVALYRYRLEFQAHQDHQSLADRLAL